jgi:hypothetical protein
MLAIRAYLASPWSVSSLTRHSLASRRDGGQLSPAPTATQRQLLHGRRRGAARVVRNWFSTMDRFLPPQTDTTASRGPQAFLAYDRYHCCARFATNRCIKLLVLVVV